MKVDFYEVFEKDRLQMLLSRRSHRTQETRIGVNGNAASSLDQHSEYPEKRVREATSTAVNPSCSNIHPAAGGP